MSSAPAVRRASKARHADAKTVDIRRKSQEALFDLVCAVEPRLSKLRAWYKSLCNTIERWYSNEGDQGIKRAKSILNSGMNLILGEEAEPLSFVKQCNNCPDLVRPLVDRVNSLKKDPRLLSAVLSVVRVTDLWYGQANSSTLQGALETIQDSRLPSSADPVIEDFVGFVHDFVEHHPQHKVVKAYLAAIPLSDAHVNPYRESVGPNGPLTANAHRDILTLKQSVCSDGTHLYDEIVKLEQCIVDQAMQSFRPSTDLADAMDQIDTSGIPHAEYPGKISLINEKSGKCRLVASPDYYSQMALAPIHDWLEGILKAFRPQDCTFDQRSAIPRIQQWHQEGKEIYSFDQSSCTDLFPFKMQLKLLSIRFGEALSESVQHVMADRVWSLRTPKGLVKKVKWSVGQPMGLKGSWPLMAVTHHFLVQYCYWLSSGRDWTHLKPYTRYVICGDDIVIGDKSVADCYLKTVRQLGMKVNLLKSHVSGGNTGVDPVSEFAKIMIWKGVPLTPIRPNMVRAAVKDPRYAVPLLQDISLHSGLNLSYRQARRVVDTYFPKGKKYLVPLLTTPRELQGVGYRDSEPMKKKFFALQAGEIHPWLSFLAAKVKAQRRTEMIQVDPLIQETSYQDLPRNVARMTPASEYYRSKVSEPGSRLLSFGGYHTARELTIPETVADICINGFGQDLDLVLPTTNLEIPPHLRTELMEGVENSNLWQRILNKDKNYHLEDVTQFGQYVRKAGGIVVYLYYLDESIIPYGMDELRLKPFQHYLDACDAAFKCCQYNVIQRFILEYRTVKPSVKPTP